MIGKTISHYRILEKLGEGGMGVVYKAEDTKLDRVVALKFLPAVLTSDPEARERFVHEARAAAALDYPNICTIYEINEADDKTFIAMAYVEGRSLKDRIACGPLKLEEAAEIALQVAQGLQAAHEKGIVHRDIKPANIMITAKGQAKIMDFGLAKSRGQTALTRADTTVGTFAYMSPEQARGEDVDPRTDIWSLGVVLHEMVTGQRPFKGDYEQAVIYSILNEQPKPLTGLRTGIPLELERIVLKCLRKDPKDRYQGIADLTTDLRQIGQESIAGVPPAPTARRSPAVQWSWLGVLVILAALAAIIFPRYVISPKNRPAAGRKMLVVLPFENLGAPEDEYFANGTTDAITARLASVTGLGVISRQSAVQYKNTTKSIRQIGHELGVDYVLEGTVQRERPGDPTSRVRVIPQLIRVRDDTHVWAEAYDEDMSEVFRVQSDIAERVAAQLDVALLEPERRAIEKRPTENLAAYEDYLRGMEYHLDYASVTDIELSVQLFQRAVQRDPLFAEAWAGLSMAYHNLYWMFERPGALALEMEAAKRAEELAPDLPETHLALGSVAYAHREFDKALEHFERAERSQKSGETAQAVGFVLRRLGRWQEALDRFEDARRLMPRNSTVYHDALGYTNTLLRRYDEAERNLDQALVLAPQASFGYEGKAWVLLARNGDVDAARRVQSAMSRRVNLAEAAEASATQGFPIPTSMLRLLPEVYSAEFDAFEAGPMERYRTLQPSAVASAHLAQALIVEALKGRESARARYDSARVYYERAIRSDARFAYVCSYHAGLGLAYAGLGRKEEALREGEEAVRMMPMSKDAVVGEQVLNHLASIYMMCGEHEAAIDRLETLLSVPGTQSPALLRIDPIWDPIRSHPRFRRLVEGK